MTREQLITAMCNAWSDDFKTTKHKDVADGMTREEQIALWHKMANIFDNVIDPNVKIKKSQKEQGISDDRPRRRTT